MSKRILVVDDQMYLRDVQVMVLNEAGYTATAIATGAEALDRLPDLMPDLIVLDMSMPHMNGRQFLARLRDLEAWAKTPVILSTGHSIEEVNAMREPRLDVLSKPFSDLTLLEHVRRMIGEAKP